MKSLLRWHLLLFFCLIFTPYLAHAHVGSKDVYEQVSAGPYKLFVTIRMPTVIPGVAMIEARSTGAPIGIIHITPLPLTGEASKHPPTSDLMTTSASDSSFYTGNLWLMRSGSWQIRFEISGPSGNQTVSVPVAAVALSTLKMQRSMGITLGLLGLFLVLSMAGIVAASVREARLTPGDIASPSRRRRAVYATAASLIFMGIVLLAGAKWWNVEAAGYSLNVFRPLIMEPVLTGNQLELNVLSETEKEDRLKQRPATRSNNDFVPDHGHMMHLYAIRWPEMDAAFHLHPTLTGHSFQIALPAMPPGEYSLYGDVVHANGFPETLVAKLNVPATMTGGPLGPEDASAHPQPISRGALGNSFKLPDGYTMLWDRPEPIAANTAYAFRFQLLDADGKPASDMQPYLGMAGHAAFVKTDGTVFAHTHPEGSADMVSLMLANQDINNSSTSNIPMDMSMDPNMKMDMPMSQQPLSNIVEFPYGFPSSGRYRIFVQMKHGTTVETGVFDAAVR